MTSETSTVFGQLLREHRLAAGLTQEALAEAAGVSVRSIQALERGESRPLRDTALRLAGALGQAVRATFDAAASPAPRRRTTTPPAIRPPSSAAASGEPPPPGREALPLFLTSFIGREREQADVVTLLGAGRLVTLTGPGGVGKTRLAIEVAGRVADTFANGAIFADLAPVRDRAGVPSAIAAALGVGEVAGQVLQTSLAAYLRHKHLLLLLDNFEQILSAVYTVADLIAACPRLTVLVTSRAPLRLRGEREFLVPPLPSPTHRLPAEALAQNPAVDLFVRRAQAIKSNFALTEANAEAIAAICRRLDGLPLAIELAAARTRLLPPPALLERLDRRLRVLISGPRDLPARQQTLRDTIGWSYDLLSAPEQALFRRLAVFVGGCTLEAAEAVCAGAGGPDLDILEGLSSLVEKSLLQSEERTSGVPRTRMLEMLREYALERLVAAGEADSLHAAHAACYLALAEEAEPELAGPEQTDWLARLEEEHDNLRAALRRLQERGEAETGLRLAGALWRFWSVRGHLSEGRNWIEGFLRLAGPPAARARALLGASRLAIEQGAYEHAAALCEECLTLARETKETQLIGRALNNLGTLARQLDDYHQAQALHAEALALARDAHDKRGTAEALHHLMGPAGLLGRFDQGLSLGEEALALFRELGDARGIATTLSALGLSAAVRGMDDRAEALCTESLPLFRRLGDTGSLAEALFTLGLVARSRGAYARATALYEESLALRQDRGDERSVAHSLNCLADVALDQGDLERAAALVEQALALLQQSPDNWAKAGALTTLGHVALRRGEFARAAASLAESLQVLWVMGNRLSLSWCLDGLAAVACALGLPERAVRLCAAAEVMGVGPLGSPAARAIHERTLASARAALGEDAFLAVWEAGHRLPPEQMIAEALHPLG